MPRTKGTELPDFPIGDSGSQIEGTDYEIEDVLGEQVQLLAIGFVHSVQYETQFVQMQVKRPNRDDGGDTEELCKLHTGGVVVVRKMNELQALLEKEEFELPCKLTLIKPKGKKYLDIQK